MRSYGHVVLGGTFDHLHVGHTALLDTAFRIGHRVSIGLTTDRYLVRHPKPLPERVQPFAVRRSVLHRWLRHQYPHRSWRTVPLEDTFGGSVEDGVDVLVVSADTIGGGKAVNAERRRRGRRDVPIVVVPVVLADDLGPVSSRRIRAGTIDANGRRRAPFVVSILASDPRDVPAVRSAARRAFSRASLEFVPPRPRRASGTPGGDPSVSRAGPDRAALEVVVRRRSTGGWELAERTGGVEIPAVRVPRGPPALLRRAALRLLRPDLGRKAYPSARPSPR